MRARMQRPVPRRAVRRGVDIACDLITERWDAPVQSHCTDLSQYGLWLDTTIPLEEGEEVVLCFKPPKRRTELTLFAVVRHVAPPRCRAHGTAIGVGLEFEGVTLWEHRLLVKVLRGIPPRLPPRARRALPN